MIKNLRFRIPHYFSKHPSREMRELYWSVGLMDLGIAAVALFEPIFLFTLGYSLQEILMFYLVLYGIYALLLPFFGRLVGRIGYEHSILYSQFFLIASYLLLFGISQYPVLFFIAPLFFAIQKSLYWPAYHADFATFSKQGQRGRAVGYMETLSTIVYVIGPFIGGMILLWTNFGVLFIVGSTLFILSALPLMRIQEVYTKIDYSYKDVVRQLFDKEHRRSFLSFLGFGEELIVLTVWPIFIYVVVGDFLEVGILVGLATLLTAVTVLFLGKFADRLNRVEMIRVGTISYFVSWIVRGIAATTWQLFCFDSLSRLSKEVLFVPFEAITYSKARRVGPLSYAVFYEQSLSIGKFLAALIVYFVVSFTTSPWFISFAVAGLFSLLYLFKREKS